MGRKEVIAQRRALEDYYYHCKLETPEEVAKLFEVYTKLIWVYHQAGLVYDYYCDETVIHREGGGKMTGGVDVTEIHTIPAFGPFPQNTSEFLEIFCVGNPQEGYKFGQMTVNDGVYSSKGATMQGRGDDSTFHREDKVNFCQCRLGKVDGRWVVKEEWLGYVEETARRQRAHSQPFIGEVPGDLLKPAKPTQEPEQREGGTEG